jgi:hypothetical protein
MLSTAPLLEFRKYGAKNFQVDNDATIKVTHLFRHLHFPRKQCNRILQPCSAAIRADILDRERVRRIRARNCRLTCHWAYLASGMLCNNIPRSILLSGLGSCSFSHPLDPDRCALCRWFTFRNSQWDDVKICLRLPDRVTVAHHVTTYHSCAPLVPPHSSPDLSIVDAVLITVDEAAIAAGICHPHPTVPHAMPFLIALCVTDTAHMGYAIDRWSRRASPR